MTGNKFIMSLEATARENGMTRPVIRAFPEWILFDYAGADAGREHIVQVEKFTSILYITNRIADVAWWYARRQKAGRV